jgi:subtilisin family serine protease
MVAIRPVLLAILMLALIPASAAANTETRIIVKRDPGLSAAERHDIRADADVRYVESLSLPRTEVVRATPGDVRDAVRDLNADPDVVYAQVAQPRRPAADPALGQQWALRNTGQFIPFFGRGTLDADMDVTLAWGASTGAGQTVAVVDTGVDRTHPDLAGKVFGGYDFVDDDSDPADSDGHGTHVAGTIAATRDNDLGGAGVAPDSIVVPLRALGPGSTDIETAEAFDWAGDRGVRIVNASLAGVGASNAEYLAMAEHPETLYVVAAGNDDDDVDIGDSAYPCAYDLDNVICVGASDPDDEAAEFSNYGATSVDLFAPGVSILSTENGGYFFEDGTSMAAPHVTGAAALVVARNPALDATAIRTALLEEGDEKPALTGKSVTGRRANANGSLLSVTAEPDADPPFSSDIDGDGVADTTDNCIEDANGEQTDGNSNDVGDACDDRDGDETFDASDNCVDVANADQANVDGDEFGDVCDDDIDGDGVLNDDPDNCPVVANPGQQDGDADGEGDACDDRDGDEVVDASDNCSDVANHDQRNVDEDEFGDVCDDDIDGDGVLNDDPDNCPTVANADQADGSSNGVGDACDDRDGDGTVDASDNCVSVSNAGQADADGDGIGDACDSTPRGVDSDGDGKHALDDSCPNQYGALANGCPPPPPNPAPPNTDGDDRIDASDACPTEYAISNDGCPLAQVASLSAKARKRRATVKVAATRVATLRITVERKKGRRWVRVTRRTVSGTAKTLRVKRLKRGRYRVRVSISSGAGAGASVSKSFRVR